MEEQTPKGGSAVKIKEVCERTGLTDRAVRLYIENGLVTPKCRENGFGRRSFDFSEEDVASLKDVAAMRSAGFSISAVREMKEDPGSIDRHIEETIKQQSAEIERSQRSLEILERIKDNPINSCAQLGKLLIQQENSPPEEDNRIRLKYYLQRFREGEYRSGIIDGLLRLLFLIVLTVAFALLCSNDQGAVYSAYLTIIGGELFVPLTVVLIAASTAISAKMLKGGGSRNRLILNIVSTVTTAAGIGLLFLGWIIWRVAAYPDRPLSEETTVRLILSWIIFLSVTFAARLVILFVRYKRVPKKLLLAVKVISLCLIPIMVIGVIGWSLFGSDFRDFRSVDRYNAFAANNSVLPTTDEIGDDPVVSTLCHYEREAFFFWESHILIARYSDDAYEQEKAALDQKYSFRTAADKKNFELRTADDFWRSGLSPEFRLDGYRFYLLRESEYGFPHEIYLIGMNDVKKAIAYVGFYDSDLDSIESWSDFLIEECGWRTIEKETTCSSSNEIEQVVGLYHIIIRSVGGGEVGETDAVKKLVGHIVVVAPHLDGAALADAVARRRVGLKTGDGCEIALGQVQHLADGIIGWIAGQLVAAALAVNALDQSGFRQRGEDALEIFERQLLSFGDVLHRNIIAAAVIGKINQYAQGVSASGRNHDETLLCGEDAVLPMNLPYCTTSQVGKSREKEKKTAEAVFLINQFAGLVMTPSSQR